MKAKIKLENQILTVDKVSRDKLIKKYGDSTKIFDCVINTSQRSTRENNLYWAVMRFITDNLPEAPINIKEYLLKALNIKKITEKLLHEIFKAKFAKESTSFESMSEADFNEYFNAVIDYIATVWLKCNPDDIIKQTKEYYKNDVY